MDITKARVHEIKYLSDVKYSNMNNCTLRGDKGYLSSEYKTDLFHISKIQLETPIRRYQKSFEKYPYAFSKCRNKNRN